MTVDPFTIQVAEEILIAVDSMLPPERELAETYKVSRMTVRQAIIELVNEGILVRRKGIGTATGTGRSL